MSATSDEHWQTGQTVGILDFIRELRSERRFEQNMAP
jgi:hypothetical protein